MYQKVVKLPPIPEEGEGWGAGGKANAGEAEARLQSRRARRQESQPYGATGARRAVSGAKGAVQVAFASAKRYELSILIPRPYFYYSSLFDQPKLGLGSKCAAQPILVCDRACDSLLLTSCRAHPSAAPLGWRSGKP
jgi:hypothetical protein